ncbi:unnamed protein product [Mytilus coruscus]|uniref:Reverse transcriptase RNase H-like domain-containing protein n=1 Tax=Mytilus coruscus TaxID=42192 RepID=A0A6J8BPR0_MYTCO|nr:unnamed protein product [Mytilus coruscus]
MTSLENSLKIFKNSKSLQKKALLNGMLNAKQHSIFENVSSPILTYPRIEKEYILNTDASGTGVGAVLSQINDDGKECAIAYYSRTLSKTERQYCVTRRELLAIVLAVKHFHHYLHGVNFRVRTDHGALNLLKNFKNPEGQLARWLETYTFIIKHRAGLNHGNADGLSRRPFVNCKHCDTRDVTEVNYQTENPAIREPLERISIVILGPVTRTYKDHKYVIVVTDYFTRYAKAYGVPDIEAQTVADKLLEECICCDALPYKYILIRDLNLPLICLFNCERNNILTTPEIVHFIPKVQDWWKD